MISASEKMVGDDMQGLRRAERGVEIAAVENGNEITKAAYRFLDSYEAY